MDRATYLMLEREYKKINSRSTIPFNVMYGNALVCLGKHEEAIDLHRFAVADRPDDWESFEIMMQVIDVTPGLPSSVSINRAWSYVQDGHTFYVIDLGTQGTYAYDTSTQQWNELQTDGTNWNMTNGVMWGQRVVAGDHVTGDVWELDPGAVTDAGGAYEIDHVVTGVVSLRGRTFVSCDAVRVAASAGVVADSGAVMNLRFSDDDGQTWSDYYPITLTEGHTYQDLAWRSLGSFRSPGRIFEFSDSGGLIRIDGADAYLDGFDNDGSAQPPPGKP